MYIYIWKLLINKNVANIKLKKKLMNTSIVVSVVNISRNMITKPRQEERTKETEPPKKKKEHDKAYRQKYYQTNRDRINEKNTTKVISKLKCFAITASVK